MPNLLLRSLLPCLLLAQLVSPAAWAAQQMESPLLSGAEPMAESDLQLPAEQPPTKMGHDEVPMAVPTDLPVDISAIAATAKGKTGQAVPSDALIETTIPAPIPADAIMPASVTPHKAIERTEVLPDIAPDVMNAPSPHGGATTLRAAPVQAELARYQFLPLFTKGAASDAIPLFWPLLSSQKLAASHGHVQRAVIVVHDATRDGAETLQQMQSLAGPTVTGDRAKTIIIAPIFPAKSDRNHFKPLLTDATPNVAAWEPEGWWQGAETNPDDNRNRHVSSMTAMDMLLLTLADTKNYPELQDIVIAGYGRGADFVHRYALYGRALDVIATQNLHPHFVVVGAQSYVYLTDARPGKVAGTFSTLKDKKMCPTYQDYPYGLEQPNDYTRLTAGNVARQNYAARKVTYLVGGNDNAAATDQACGAAVQGKSVKDRAVNFQAYLKSNFGDTPTHKLLIMPSAGEDALALLGDNCGASLLFSDGECLRAGGAK